MWMLLFWKRRCLKVQKQPSADPRISSGIPSSATLWICWSERMAVSQCCSQVQPAQSLLGWVIPAQLKPSQNLWLLFNSLIPWLQSPAWFLCLPRIWLLCVSWVLCPLPGLWIWMIFEGLVSGCITGSLCPVNPVSSGARDGRTAPGLMSRQRQTTSGGKEEAISSWASVGVNSNLAACIYVPCTFLTEMGITIIGLD